MKKFKLFLLFLTISIFSLAYTLYARVIYKDISSISIKTNFTFDYESLEHDGLPDISFNSDGNSEDNVYIYPTTKYTIESCEWYQTDFDSFNIGSEPRVIVYLQTKEYPDNYSDNDYYYRFLSSYNSSNCYISNGTFVSAQRLSNEYLRIIFKLRSIKGTYNPPTSAYWANESGGAVWTPDNILDSGYYDLVLTRDGSTVAHIDKYRGNNYNFAQYMTRVGDYVFKVRTVAGSDTQSLYAKSSEYLESNSLYIDESRINNGISQSTTNNNGTNVGFVQQNGRWYFYNPTGQMIKNGWAKWNNKWYYFDGNGEMKTGLITVSNETYYLSNNGDMMLGWLKSGDSYYYFDTSANDHNGAMLKNSWLLYDNKYFYFDNTGVMVTGWKNIPDKNNNTGYYYFYPSGTTNGLYGYMATNTVIDGFHIGSDGKWTGS